MWSKYNFFFFFKDFKGTCNLKIYALWSLRYENQNSKGLRLLSKNGVAALRLRWGGNFSFWFPGRRLLRS